MQVMLLESACAGCGGWKSSELKVPPGESSVWFQATDLIKP